MREVVYDIVVELGGSISAEHGIGQANLEPNLRTKSAVEIDLMRKVKAALDPENLMNPGKVVPGESDFRAMRCAGIGHGRPSLLG